MTESNLKQKTLVGFFWRFAERCGAQGVALIVQLVLARLIEPKLFGVVALISVITNILQVFVDSGLGVALVQKKDADDLDFSSVFYFNFAVCLLLYILMFVLAPVIDEVFYKGQYENLASYLRVLNLVLVISGVKNVQQAYVSRKMIFKKFFFATLGGTIFAAILGIVMAIMGFGAWAIIVQNLANKFIDTCVLWFTVKWRPKLLFSWERLKGLLSYGWKILISTLISSILNEVRQLIIGGMYSATDLAFYNQGKKFPDALVSNINTSIDSVLLPAMSKKQERVNDVKSMIRRSIKISTYVLWPILIGGALVAGNFIHLIIGEKWLESVPFLQIFCVTFTFWLIRTPSISAIKSIGRSDIILILEIIDRIVSVAFLIGSMFIGVEAMAYSLCISTFLSMMIKTFPLKKLINYGYFELFKDVLPNLMATAMMSIAIIAIGLIDMQYIVQLFMQMIFGGIVYLLASRVFKNESYEYILNLIVNGFKKRKRE